VIDVALLSVIRRWNLREGVSIHEIARRTQLSRDTVRKYLADGTLQPAYLKRKSPSKLDPYSEMLASWLERESTRGRKQRRNWRQLFDDLVALGYRGSYDRVAAFARAWERRREEQATHRRVSPRIPLRLDF
jgi:transposase